jgi:FkbM family methyltransferase
LKSNVLSAFVRDLKAGARLAADMRSMLRLSVDFTLSRLIAVVPRTRRNRVREVNLNGGIKLRYRLNKGDLHSIREIWYDEEYRLPFVCAKGILLDLGANIGMASVWLAKKYSFGRVIAIEPDPTNASLVRQNLEINHIDGHVLEGAIGPMDGMARFEFSDRSNLGKLSEIGSPVQMMSLNTIVTNFQVKDFSLIKIDIEGGEEGLFKGPTEWLNRTDAIIMEFHPAIVDCTPLVAIVCSHGLRHIPSHSLIPDNLDCFTRQNPDNAVV